VYCRSEIAKTKRSGNTKIFSSYNPPINKIIDSGSSFIKVLWFITESHAKVAK
jgi:hypothetical protein